MILKKTFISLLSVLLVIAPLQLFAQSLPGGLFNSIVVQNKWFANQERVQSPYTQQACLQNNGVYKNQRLYLNADQDNDGLKDYKYGSSTFHLKDNMLYYGDASTDYRLALITPKGIPLDNGNAISIGSTVYYYTPAANSNIFSLFNNNTSYPIDTNRAWYRFSKVAPINQPVRAITSEAVLIEQPSTALNPVDRMMQVAYQLRYATYRSINNNINSDYQVFPVANMNDFSSLWSVNSWYLKNPIQDNGWYGPSWNTDYQQTDATIPTKAINRWPERTHGLECLNYHFSRCGDGYIDVSGQQPINGSTTQPHPISDSGVSETCDPGTNLSSYTDDVMPNGATPTAYYNCTATCTIVNNPQSPILVYTKTVRNVTTNNNNGQFVEADSQSSAVIVKTWDVVQYQITINRTWWPVTNTILTDPAVTNNGFSISAYSINGGSQIPVSIFPIAGINLTSQLNTSSPVVVTLYGTVTNPTATQFVNTATLTDPAYPAGVPTTSPGSNVAWTVLDNIPPLTPDVSIKKEVEVSLNSNTRQELSTTNPGQTVRFKITYKNISSVNALNALITDTLPTWLTCVSAVHQDGAAIPCVSNGISYTEATMNPWVEKYIIITATITSTISTGVTTNTANIQLPWWPVKSDPAQVQPQSITDFLVTKRILSGAVVPGTVIKYEIGFKNTGNTPINSYMLTDPLQSSTYVAGSSRLNNSILITPSYISNLLTRWCNTTNTALNGQTVCPLQAWASGTIVFDVLVN
jgi:uncharacterized repeat protein (TIGR01451 family)